MLKAILIDDEPQSIIATKVIIEKISPEVEVVGTYTDPFKGLEAIKTTSFGLLLLDIEMPGLTGLELLKRIENINFDIIFVTAYSEYAIDAIKLSALDYILKPINPTKLAMALEKAKDQANKKQKINERLKILELLLTRKEKGFKSQEQRMAFSSQQDINYVQIKKIIRIEGAKNYCYFFLSQEKKIVVSKHLGFYNNSFLQFNFMKIHRSHIVNLYHVKRFIREGYVEMSNGDKIRFSGALRNELLEKLAEL